MKEASHDQFVAALMPGDAGLILAKNPFSMLQNWQRLKNKVKYRASHAFMMKSPPIISEANGLHIKNATMLKYVGDSTKCWIFRYRELTPAQLDDMMDYMDGAVENGGTYSIGGIIQFGLQFFGIRKKMHDESGSFCSEYNAKTIMKAGIPLRIGNLKPFEIDPSTMLSWFLSDEGKKMGWDLVGNWDGSKYWIDYDLHMEALTKTTYLR